MDLPKPLNEDQRAQLEAFVRAPVYQAFKQLIEAYRQSTLSQILTEKNPQKLYELQGRMLAINAIERLPEVVATQEAHKRKIKITEETEQDQRRETLRKRKYSR